MFFIALRYIKGSKKQRFASFVAALATLGIAIGVCALIVVSSIMQGLQERLKENILSDCAHLVVKADQKDIPYLLSLPHVRALVPFVQGEAMLQFNSDIAMVTLQASDNDSLYLRTSYAKRLGITPETVADYNRIYAHKLSNDAAKLASASDENDTESPDAAADPVADAAEGSAADADSAADAATSAHHSVASAGASGTGTADDVDSAMGVMTDINGNPLIKVPLMDLDALGYAYGSVYYFDKGLYQLAVNYTQMMQFGMDTSYDSKVRLISTQNARYTPFGMTPVQRNFEVAAVINSLDKSHAPTVVGNYDDVRRFMRLGRNETYYRLYLSDPFLIENTVTELDGKYEYTDWRSRYGDFFKAVGLEKISMSVMLCLIVVVAAFNILSSLTMVVSSRVSEIAVLKTIGMKNSSLLAVFSLVGMSSGIAGSVLGVIAGIPIALNAQTMLSALGVSITQGELPVSIDPMNIVIIIVLCLGVSLLCTFYPAYYAAKADPASNLVNS